MKARVTSLDVRCTDCGAIPGGRCHTAGAPTGPHPRRRQAARDEDARRNPEHVPGQLTLWPMSA